MTREDAEHQLSEAGRTANGEFPLLGAGLSCALHKYPERDVEPARALGRAGVERLSQRLASESPEEALAETMAGDLRLAGDLFTYEHPDNADIIAVAERRKGLPVA